MRTHLTKGKKVQEKEKVDMHAYFTEKYKRMAAHRAKLKAAAVLKTNENKTTNLTFKTTRDTVSNNSLVTNKLIIPNKLSLPATGYPGQIVYDASTAKYWGWTPNGWSDLVGGGDTFFERIGYPTSTISPNVVTTLIETGIPGLASWAARVAGVEDDTGYGISVNDIGDIVVTGKYSSDDLTVYNQNGSVVTTLTNSGGYDAFIVKYSIDGTAIWATRIAGVYNDDSGLGISINNSGDIVVTGYYYSNGELTAYNQDGSIGWTLPSAIYYDTFVVKYSSDGKVLWATRFADLGSDLGSGISINDSSDIVVTGRYSINDLTIYNQDESVAWTLPNSLDDEAFVVKYSSEGIVSWAARIDSLGYGVPAISINNKDDIIITGGYQNDQLTVHNQDGSVAWTLPKSGMIDAFIVNYSFHGMVSWVTRISGLSINFGYGVFINERDDIVVTGGYSSNPLTLYNQDGNVGWTLASSGYSDIFIVKYSIDGIVSWATRIAGVISDEVGYSVCINDSCDIVATGYYSSNEVTVYNQDGSTAWTLPNSGYYDAFIVKYSIDGTAIWATRIAGVSIDIGWGISINNTGNIVVTGAYNSNELTVYNQDGILAMTLPNSGGYDVFIVKFIDEQLSTSLANPVKDSQIKRIVSSGPQVTVSPVATVDNLTQSLAINNDQSLEMLWDATKENWIILARD